MCIGVAPPVKAPWPHPIIAREGWPFLALTLVAAGLVTVFAGWAWADSVWIIASSDVLAQL